MAGGGGRVVDLCRCINKRVKLLFGWPLNRDKGILGLDSGPRCVWVGVGERGATYMPQTDRGGRVRFGQVSVLLLRGSLRHVLHWAGLCCESG